MKDPVDQKNLSAKTEKKTACAAASTRKNQKSAVNNQWVSTGKKSGDDRERRDGPGGEDA
ncbi:MAG: hypothetical protein ACLSVG_04200 [Clostridia bacterium]